MFVQQHRSMASYEYSLPVSRQYWYRHAVTTVQSKISAPMQPFYASSNVQIFTAEGRNVVLYSHLRVTEDCAQKTLENADARVIEIWLKQKNRVLRIAPTTSGSRLDKLEAVHRVHMHLLSSSCLLHAPP